MVRMTMPDGTVCYVPSEVPFEFSAPPEVSVASVPMPRFAIRDLEGNLIENANDPAEAADRAKAIGHKERCTVFRRLRTFVVEDDRGRYFGDDDDRSGAERQLIRLGRPGLVRNAKPGEEVALQHWGPEGSTFSSAKKQVPWSGGY